MHTEKSLLGEKGVDFRSLSSFFGLIAFVLRLRPPHVPIGTPCRISGTLGRPRAKRYTRGNNLVPCLLTARLQVYWRPRSEFWFPWHLTAGRTDLKRVCHDYVVANLVGDVLMSNSTPAIPYTPLGYRASSIHLHSPQNF